MLIGALTEYGSFALNGIMDNSQYGQNFEEKLDQFIGYPYKYSRIFLSRE